MLVSFCVIAYNEEKALPSLFRDIISQDYPHDKMEVILVDAMSKMCIRDSCWYVVIVHTKYTIFCQKN